MNEVASAMLRCVRGKEKYAPAPILPSLLVHLLPADLLLFAFE